VIHPRGRAGSKEPDESGKKLEGIPSILKKRGLNCMQRGLTTSIKKTLTVVGFGKLHCEVLRNL
jgi:hypothetical protein